MVCAIICRNRPTMADAPGWLPSQQYQAGVERGEWAFDAAQQAALVELDRLHQALLEPPRRGWRQRLRLSSPPSPLPGLYLWGGVGRGKTFLIDLFYHHLPLPVLRPYPPCSPAEEGKSPAFSVPGEGRGGKYRTHFHRFMQGLHALLRQHAGERDPLARIVAGWRGRLRVLVLDEFFVSDIGDAMLLARLLARLFAEGIVLLTTSNAPPAGLYKDGLQRARFLPAIALLQQHCRVLELVSDTDYRLRALTASPVWRAPLDAQSDAWLAVRWQELGGTEVELDTRQQIEIGGRKIAVRARRPGMVWFDFSALCEGARAAGDYIQIAGEFHTVLLGSVPLFDGQHDDAARRFITLVDELYDRQVNLVCTAAAMPPLLYSGRRLAFAFERTASRLIEMRSADYLARAHLC